MRTAADLVRLAGVLSLAVAAGWYGAVATALFALVLLGLLLPKAGRAAPWLDLLCGVVLLCAAWSAVLDLYLVHAWLDVVMHVSTTALVLAVLSSFAPEHAGGRLAVAGVVTCVGLSLGVLWEFGEWYGHTYLDESIQVGYADTLGDLAADGAGALLAGLALARRSAVPVRAAARQQSAAR